MEITLTGTIYEGTYTAKGVYEGIVFPYFVHIPACAEEKDNCALIVMHDGLNTAEAWAMDAVPIPASLVKTPLAQPTRSA